MKNSLTTPCLLLILTTMLGCQQGTDEDKSLASTHPKLEKQLARDSVETRDMSETSEQVYQRYRITMEEYRNAPAHRVPSMYGGRLAPLDENSHADARTFRTALHNGLKQGVNFAGKYTVVSVGCGTSCQTHYVVDRESGRVLDKLESNMGAEYKPNSNLFIINPPDSTVNYKECAYCAPAAYVFENGRFRKVSPAHAQQPR